MNELSFISNEFKLVGTVVVPDASNVVALLVSGSGVIDRDSNHADLKMNVMGEIAEYLESHDIASFRYDKRGVGESEGVYLEASFDDNLRDAEAALDLLKERFPDKKLMVIGHSEGGMIATRLAAKRDDLAGIVLLAAPAQLGRDLLKWQLDHVKGALKGLAKWIVKIFCIDVHKRHEKFMAKLEKSDEPVMKVMWVRKVNAAWLREFADYNPADDFPKITCPVLAITGAKDIQVPPQDLDVMQDKIGGNCTAYEINNLTHILRRDFEEPSLEHYKALAKLPLDEEMLGLINEWVLACNTVVSFKSRI